MAALDAGHVAFAGLDVVEREPLDDERVRRHPRVLLTPHAAFYSVEGFHEMRTKGARGGAPHPARRAGAQPRQPPLPQGAALRAAARLRLKDALVNNHPAVRPWPRRTARPGRGTTRGEGQLLGDIRGIHVGQPGKVREGPRLGPHGGEVVGKTSYIGGVVVAGVFGPVNGRSKRQVAATGVGLLDRGATLAPEQIRR